MALAVVKFAAIVPAILFPALFCRAAEVPSASALPARAESGEQLVRMLDSNDPQARMMAAGVAAKHPEWSYELDEPLRMIAFDVNQPNALRLEVIAAIAPRLSPVDPHLFELVRSNLSSGNPPMLRLTAARALATFRLSDMQMLSVAKCIGEADALVLPTLLGAFSRTSNDAAGLSVVIALGKTPAEASLSADQLAHLLRHYSTGVRTAAKPLLEPLAVDLDKQRSHLEDLAPLLDAGDAGRGRQVFSASKAGCSVCHGVSGAHDDGQIGPDLSHIAGTRNAKELLELVIYPSAGSVPGFGPFKVETTDGQHDSGTIVSPDLANAISVRDGSGAATWIDAKRIKSIEASSATVMPKGIEDTLSKDELRDLLAYLQSLK